MANIYSLQLLRNGQIFTSYTAAKDAILTSTTQDGVIKLARYTDSTATPGDSKYQTSTVKTIFGIYANFSGGTGWTIYDSYYEIIKNLQDQIDSMTGGAGSIAQQIEAALDQLDYSGVTIGNGVVVTNVTETNGAVEATAAEVGGLQLTNYSNATSGTVAAGDTINEAISKLQNQITEKDAETDAAIEALDATIDAADGFIIDHIEQVDGKISGTTKELPTVAEISEAGKPIVAVSETKGTVSAATGTISAQYVDVADADGNLTATNVEAALAEVYSGYVAGDEAIVGGASDSANTLAKLETVVNNLSADAKEYEIEKITTGLNTNVKEAYKLVDAAGNQSGDTIEIYYDNAYKEIYLGTSADTINATTGEITKQSGDKQSLNYAYMKADGTYDLAKVNVSAFLTDSEFASGVTATDSIVHGVVDPASEPFLTVGADGFKLAGVQDAIVDAIEALDYSGITTSDAAVVTNVTETDGVVAATAANVGGLKLTGYQQGSDDADVAATDTINEAFAKLQNQIAAAEETAQGAHSKVEKDANAAHLTLTSTTDASGATVYTIGETNIANANDLETVSGKVDDAQAEIDAIETAVGLGTDGSFTPDAANAYTSGATSVADAIDKLDDAAKANADAIAQANQDAITGITVNGSGVTVTDNVAALTATYTNTAVESENGMVITTGENGGLTFQFGTLDAGTY